MYLQIRYNFEPLRPAFVGVMPHENLLGPVGDLYCFSNTFRMLVYIENPHVTRVLIVTIFFQIHTLHVESPNNLIQNDCIFNGEVCYRNHTYLVKLIENVFQVSFKL